jgi:hypothetical protein
LCIIRLLVKITSRWRALLLAAFTSIPGLAQAADDGDAALAREEWLERLEPRIFVAGLEQELQATEEPCTGDAPAQPPALELGPVVWGAFPSPLERPLFGLAPGEAVSSTFASLRVVELEDQRKTRLLDRLQFTQRSTVGNAGNLLSGDVVGAAGVAAGALSLSLKFGGKKRATDLLLDNRDPERALWSFGLGLGRLGLKLRSEW